MSNSIFADSISGVVLSNGVIRIQLARFVGDNKAEVAGHLLIPANQAGLVVDQIAANLKEISDKIKEQQSEDLAEKAVAALEDSE